MHWFDPRPAVKIKVPNGMRDVSSVEAALEVMQGWVRDKGLTPGIEAAYIVCAEVIDGTKPAEDARKAFVEAAREMGKLRGED